MGFFDSILFIVLSITLLFHLPIVAAKDTLFPGDELSHPSKLVSSNGIFTLGFFTTYNNLTYLGIWYTNVELSSIVWIANRDQPIDGDAILTMDASSGTVRVKNRSGATLFNVSDDKNNTWGMLHETGNFIVYDIVTNRTIWESFDHPTDTLLVGMKLGYNHTSKKNWELTSWADQDNPSLGAFTLKLKQYQKSPQLLIYRHRVLYWASGPWNKTTEKFQWSDDSYTTATMLVGLGRFDLKYDPSGMYLIVQMIGYRPSTSPLEPPTGVKLIPSDFCDGHPPANGCVVSKLSTPLPCHLWEHSYPDSPPPVNEVYHWEIWQYSYLDYKIGSFYHFLDDNSSIRIGDCKERCWIDCVCTACSTYNDNGTGCIYYGTYNDDSGFKDVQLSKKYIWILHRFPKFLYPKSKYLLL